MASALGKIIGPENVEVLALLKTGCAHSGSNGCDNITALCDRPTLQAKARFAVKAVKAARKKYDLIICSHVALSPVAAAIHGMLGTPFWVACHDAEVWDRLAPYKLAGLKRAERALPVSHFTAGMLCSVNGFPAERVRILRNAIPEEFARLLVCAHGTSGAPVREAIRRRYILSVGSLAKAQAYKGFDTVIRALPGVLAEAPDVQYLIVGAGDNQTFLESLAREVGVRDNVTFAGALGDRELAEAYHGCEVFVMPSRTAKSNGRWHGEGFGRVYVEAALAGKPVVGSTGGGAREAVLHRKTGLLADATSVSEVGDALCTLLRSPELRAKMGQEGRRWACATFSQATLQSELAKALREGGYLQ